MSTILTYDADNKERTIVLKDTSFIIPPFYNLPHYGNICHFNSCLILLSSMTKLYQNVPQLFEKSLLQAFAFNNLYNEIITTLIVKLDIDVINEGEAVNTMYILYKYLMENVINVKSIIFYYNGSLNILSKDLIKLPQKEIIASILPLYLIIDVEVWNNGENSENFEVNQNAPEMITIGEHEYMLFGLIINGGNHFISAIASGNNLYNIYNDIIESQSDIECHPKRSYNFLRGLKHSIAAYLKIK